jgi:hypothetical protein
MFVYYFVEVARPFAEAEPAALRLGGWLQEAAGASYREGEKMQAKVGLPHLPIAKAVRLEVGTPIRASDITTVPLNWEATGPAALFQIMEADLVIARLPGETSQLSFRGSYHPPLGQLGTALDRVMHRVAEGTVRRFTDRVAAALVDAPVGRTDL